MQAIKFKPNEVLHWSPANFSEQQERIDNFIWPD